MNEMPPVLQSTINDIVSPDMSGIDISPDPVRKWHHKLRNQWEIYKGCSASAMTSTAGSHSGCVIASALSGVGSGSSTPFILPFLGDFSMKAAYNFVGAPIASVVLTPVVEKILGNNFSLNPRNENFITSEIGKRHRAQDFSFNPIHKNFVLNVAQDYTVKKSLTAAFVSLVFAAVSHVSAPHLSEWTKNTKGYDLEDRARAMLAFGLSLTPEERNEALRLAKNNDGLANAVLYLRPDICQN